MPSGLRFMLTEVIKNTEPQMMTSSEEEDMLGHAELSTLS